MNYRINTFNENYIMLCEFNIFLEITKLLEKENQTKEEQKNLKLLQDIINCKFNYRNEKGRKPIIEEIAIDKYSELGNYVMTSEEQKRTDISMHEIINALLACIEKEEWQYYERLTQIIKKFKEQNCSKHDYISFKITMGSEITNYIIRNSKRIPTTYSSTYNDQNVYLYENNKIIETILPELTVTNPKTKERIK